VPLAPGDARREIDAWLQSQLFEAVRDRPESAVYERRRDRRAWRDVIRDRDGRFRLRPVDRVLVAVAPVPGDPAAASIRVEAELRRRRSERAADEAKGWTGWAVVGGTVLVLGPVSWIPVAVGAPFVAGGIGVAAWRRAGRQERADVAAVELAVDGALDRLESGAR
jgi:hypothetical protein